MICEVPQLFFFIPSLHVEANLEQHYTRWSMLVYHGNPLFSFIFRGSYNL